MGARARRSYCKFATEQVSLSASGLTGAGKEKQDNTGLYDYGARFYDPVIGRWGTVDPLAENHPNLTSYNYVMNNPMRYMDPFGLDTLDAHRITPEQWQTFDTSVDVMQLAEVVVDGNNSVTGENGSGNATGNDADGPIFTDALDYVGKGLGVTGLAVDLRRGVEAEYLRQARLNRQIARDFSRPINHSLRQLSRTGRRIGYLGLATTAVDMAYNGVNVSNTLDAVMGGIAFTGWGAPVSAAYFIANWGVEAYSGQSIGQHLQGTFTDPNASVKIW